MDSTKREAGGERGAAAVEFALVMPILVILLLGIMQYGLYFMDDLRVSNGAMAAARANAINDPDWEQVGRDGSPDIAGIQVLETRNCGPDKSRIIDPLSTGSTKYVPANSVAVTVRASYTGLFGDLIPTPSKLEARGVVRCEGGE